MCVSETNNINNFPDFDCWWNIWLTPNFFWGPVVSENIFLMGLVRGAYDKEVNFAGSFWDFLVEIQSDFHRCLLISFLVDFLAWHHTRWRIHDLQLAFKSKIEAQDKFFHEKVPFPKSVFLAVQLQLAAYTCRYAPRWQLKNGNLE